MTYYIVLGNEVIEGCIFEENELSWWVKNFGIVGHKYSVLEVHL